MCKCISDFIRGVLDNTRVFDMMGMGHFRRFSLFGVALGYEWWGTMKPACMWAKGGDIYTPLLFGLWIKHDVQAHP